MENVCPATGCKRDNNFDNLDCHMTITHINPDHNKTVWVFVINLLQSFGAQYLKANSEIPILTVVSQIGKFTSPTTNVQYNDVQF